MTDRVLSTYFDRLNDANPLKLRGRVQEVTGLIVRATVPEASIGHVVRIIPKHGEERLAEIVGFAGESAVLMPLGTVDGIGNDAEVETTHAPFSVRCGPGLMGRVLDGLGRPIDGGPPLDEGFEDWSIDRAAPHPLARQRIEEPMPTGVRAIDGLLTFAKGQRIGLFAGSGVGKSTLMGQIARGALADVNVICLIGERGREVRDFIEDVLGEEGLRRSIVVCATSDAPSLIRLKSAFVATAIAEWFRDRGDDVFLMMDSTTRFARAQREVGLAAGEAPARQGYPPSVFAMLPRLLERAGAGETGTITALYTVLVAGGDMEEPIADEVRGILDGHIILDRKMGARNHWPAIDVLVSLSRVMNSVVSKEHKQFAGRLREIYSTYEAHRDLITLGAYEYGTDEKVDLAIDVIEEIEAVLKQDLEEWTPLEETVSRMGDIVA